MTQHQLDAQCIKHNHHTGRKLKSCMNPYCPAFWPEEWAEFYEAMERLDVIRTNVSATPSMNFWLIYLRKPALEPTCSPQNSFGNYEFWP